MQEQRAKAAEEAPRDDAAAAEFVDDMVRQFAIFEGDAAPLNGINAIRAQVGVEGGSGRDDGGADDVFNFSSYLDFDSRLEGSGAGTVGVTPELVHGSSATPSPESGSEPEPAAPASKSREKTNGA